MNTSEVLNRAADLIEERGWQAGGGWDPKPDEPLCVEGAIQAAMGIEVFTRMWSCSAYRAVRAYIGCGSVFSWNDHLAHDRVQAAHDRVQAAIDRGEHDVIGEVRAEAHEWATTEAVATLRAVALIEAAKENTTTAAPESVPA